MTIATPTTIFLFFFLLFGKNPWNPSEWKNRISIIETKVGLID
jgi:hypothetical protein